MLLGLIADGDQAAFSRFMDMHLRPVTLFATRFLSSREEGEDVAQTVFIEVWRKAAQFDRGKASARTWLYSIARHRCIDAMRRLRIRRFVGLEDLAQEPPDLAPTALQRSMDKDRLRAALSGVARLPDRQRMALLLSVVADLSTRDIAGSLGTSEGAVEQLIVRARRTLRQELARTGYQT